MASRFCNSLLPLACSLVLLVAAGGSTAVAAADAAPMLYKCVDAAGVTSIQSKACAKGATTAWKRPAPPEAPMSPAASAQAEAKKLHDQQTVRDLSAEMERQRARDLAARQAAAAAASDDEDADLPTAAAPARAAVPADAEPPAVADPDLKACQDAQAFANAAHDKAWLGLSEDQVRRLYGWVAQQCKVPGA